MSVPRFWREIPQRYNLIASHCTHCDAMHFPPRDICPECRRASIGHMERKPLSGHGTVLESTRVHKPAPGYEGLVPYVVALIQTDEGPILTGQVIDVDAVEPGTKVHGVFRKLGQDGDSGVIYYGTKWAVDRAEA